MVVVVGGGQVGPHVAPRRRATLGVELHVIRRRGELPARPLLTKEIAHLLERRLDADHGVGVDVEVMRVEHRVLAACARLA